jgi:hypothetical protein
LLLLLLLLLLPASQHHAALVSQKTLRPVTLSRYTAYKPSANTTMPWDLHTTGGFSTDDRNRKSTCRDLNLSYGTLSDAASPDLPIFGRTASVTPIASTPAALAAAGQRWQQEQYEAPSGRHHHQQQQQRGRSSGEDSTGELYSSLIHSNIHGMDRRVPEAGAADMDGGSDWDAGQQAAAMLTSPAASNNS